ncbi:hypothetical protein [Paraburkholderia sp. BR10954]|uniref:hypothetical protein n=1 Tax=Paraburkholderia sp. BR10954 TaxID=3236995 RepID=UPI0034D3680C
MADSYDLTLPEWLTLAQAAEWLSERTQSVSLKWTADSLLATLCTSVGPLSEIHTTLPLWLALPGTGFLVYSPSAGQALALDETPFIPITHGTALLLHMRASIEFDEARVRFDGDKTGRFDAGTNPAPAVSRDWLAVRGFDLLMFLRAYVDVQKKVQNRLHAPAPDVKTDERGTALIPANDAGAASASATEQTEPASAAGTVVSNHRQRVSPLAAEISEARRRAAAPHDWQSVWHELRELALGEYGRFTGEIRDGDGALGYMKQKKEVKYFTPNALRGRFYRQRNARQRTPTLTNAR